MAPERILVIHNRYRQRGGEDVVVDEEVRLLRAHGHEVELYGRDNACIEGMARVRLARETVWSSRTVQELEREIDAFAPDVIHVHNSFPLVSPSLYWTARRMSCPVVQTLHNFRLLCLQAMFLRNNKVCEDCKGASPWRGVVRGCYHDSLAASAVLASMLIVHRGLGTFQRKVNRYIALNEFSRGKFIEGGLPADRIEVKPNFLPDVAQMPGPRQGGLFVGRLAPEKGVELLGQALDLLPGASMDVIGEGPELEMVQQHRQMRSLGVLPREDVLARMQRATFLVMPSIWYETFGMVQIEAFACGLPVLAPNMGSMQEMIEHGRTGLLFEPGNQRELAACMAWALDHPAEMEAMGRNARAVYLDRYTPERNYEQLIGIYQAAINEVRVELT
jgi:glycosyltransferase involved in cell wall biosynthesis